MSLLDFLSMGGYGAYVWSAYALMVAVLAWNVAAPLVCLRRRRRP